MRHAAGALAALAIEDEGGKADLNTETVSELDQVIGAWHTSTRLWPAWVPSFGRARAHMP